MPKTRSPSFMEEQSFLNDRDDHNTADNTSAVLELQITRAPEHVHQHRPSHYLYMALERDLK